MTKPMISTGDWQAEASASIRKQRAAWLGTIATGLVGGAMFGLSISITNPIAHALFIGAGVLLSAIALVWGTLIYMSVIDEQERDANLWGTYVGLTVYLILYSVKFGADAAGIAIPIGHDGIFVATMAATLAVFGWKRFG
ncbi:hypothetical protein [Sphingomonas sp. 28-63-12]|uniref:hypothetical protein n=1 Tax=Sphingomonas sp. 28-63-12 TaxID=1970434 RepID=UPI0035A8568E